MCEGKAKNNTKNKNENAFWNRFFALKDEKNHSRRLSEILIVIVYTLLCLHSLETRGRARARARTRALFTLVEFDRTWIGLRLKFDRIRLQFDVIGTGQGGFLPLCLLMNRKALPTWLRAPDRCILGCFWLLLVASGCSLLFLVVLACSGLFWFMRACLWRAAFAHGFWSVGLRV